MNWHRLGDRLADAVLVVAVVILAATVVGYAPGLAIIAGAIIAGLYLAGLALLATRGPRR